MQKKMVTLMAVAGLAVSASSAFAAAQLNAGSTTIALEALAPGVPFAVPANIAYQTSGPAAANTTFIKITTTGTFPAVAGGWNICNGATPMAQDPAAPGVGATTADGDTSFTVQLVAPLASGTVYTIQDNNCAVAAQPAHINVPADSAVGTTVSLSVDNANSPNDANLAASAIVATVKKQFSATVTPVTSVISFLASSKNFKAAGTAATPPFSTATTSVAGFNLLSDESIATKVATGLANNSSCGTAALDATDIVNVKVAGTFTELAATPNVDTTVSVVPVLAGAEQAPVAASAVVKGTDTSATVPVPGNAVTVCGTNATAGTLAKNQNEVVLTAPGTTTLVPRTFTTAVSFKGATATILNSNANIGPLAAATLSNTFKLDTTAFIAPYVKFSPDGTQQSYFKLTFKGTTGLTAPLKISVVGTDGALHALDFGTLTAGQTVQVTGGDIVTAATNAGVTLGQVNGVFNFPATFEIQATESDSYAYGVAAAGTFFTRIPMKVNGGAIVE